jgi:hypothetical protein
MQARVQQIQATFLKDHEAFLAQHPPLSPPAPAVKVLKEKKAAAACLKIHN